MCFWSRQLGFASPALQRRMGPANDSDHGERLKLNLWCDVVGQHGQIYVKYVSMSLWFTTSSLRLWYLWCHINDVIWRLCQADGNWGCKLRKAVRSALPSSCNQLTLRGTCFHRNFTLDRQSRAKNATTVENFTKTLKRQEKLYTSM